MSTKGQKGPKHNRFGGVAYPAGTEMETREVSLPVETWEKLDEFSQDTVMGNHKTKEISLWNLLHYYLQLCRISKDYCNGMLIDPSAKDNEES